MKTLVLLLVLMSAAVAQPVQQPPIVFHFWSLSATSSSQSQSLIVTDANAASPRSPGSSSVSGWAKTITVIYPTSIGPNIVWNATDATALASPVSGGHDVLMMAGQAPMGGDGLWSKISYISTGANQTFYVLTTH